MKRTRLAQRRRAVGLTQEMLAEQLVVDRTTIARWELGMSIPLPWQRPNLAMALKVSVEQLAVLLGDVDDAQSEEDERLDVVAAVLADSWRTWPESHEVKPIAAAHLQPSSAGRTLKELSIFVRGDMLTRRETFTQAVKAVSGPALLAPIAGWLDALPGQLQARDHGTKRIGASDVEALERSTRFFAVTDAEIGGALSREAAVGQFKYAVDLARCASYAQATGHRLLAVIAKLAGLVGYMCHDSGMPGPAQRYFTHGLQAARESADPRAPFLVASILTDLAEHIRDLDRPDTALQLQDLAIKQLPVGRDQFNALRAMLLARRVGNGLAYLGPSRVSEIRSTMARSTDLYGHTSDHDKAATGALWHRAIDVSEAELAVPAAVAYLMLARKDRSLVSEAEKYTLLQLAKVPEGQGRSRLFAKIRLASIRFLAGEAEQACDDGDQALQLAERITSARIQARLRELLTDSEPYDNVPRVMQFRERLLTTIGRLQ